MHTQELASSDNANLSESEMVLRDIESRSL